MTTTAKIALECENIKTLLLEKNANYGNSALEPLNVFSKLDAAEAIQARIDDKLIIFFFNTVLYCFSRFETNRSFS